VRSLLETPCWVVDRDLNVCSRHPNVHVALAEADYQTHYCPRDAPFIAVRVVPVTVEHRTLPAEAVLSEMETVSGLTGPRIQLLHAEARKALEWAKARLKDHLARLSP